MVFPNSTALTNRLLLRFLQRRHAGLALFANEPERYTAKNRDLRVDPLFLPVNVGGYGESGTACFPQITFVYIALSAIVYG